MAIRDIQYLKRVFANEKEPDETDFADIFDSFMHWSTKLPISQIFGLREEIAKVTTNFKGYHTTLDGLLVAHPQSENKKDFYAWVGSPYPGTVHVVKVNGGAWTDTGEVPTQQEIDLTEYARVKEVEKKADEIDLDGNMVVRAPNGKIDLPENIVNLTDINEREIDSINENKAYRVTYEDFSSVFRLTSVLDKKYIDVDGNIQDAKDTDVHIYRIDKRIRSVFFTGVIGSVFPAFHVFVDGVLQESIMLTPSTVSDLEVHIKEYNKDYDLILTRSHDAPFNVTPNITPLFGDVAVEKIETLELKYIDDSATLKTATGTDTFVYKLGSNVRKISITFETTSVFKSIHFFNSSNTLVKTISFDNLTRYKDVEIDVPSGALYLYANNPRATNILSVKNLEVFKIVDYYYLISNDNKQTKLSKDLLDTSYREKASGIWGDWKKKINISVGESSGNYLTPNMYKEGTQIERINSAILDAINTFQKVVIPRIDTVEETDVWLIDSAILLYSNIHLVLDNCKIKLSDKCRDNFIRTANCGLGITDIKQFENIKITGIGNVSLEGADNPRSTGNYTKTLTLNSHPTVFNSYGTDAGKAGYNQMGGWLNNGIVFAFVNNFEITNIKLKDFHCHGLILERCTNGFLSDIEFDAVGYKFINGVKQYFKNQDGMGIRLGCNNIHMYRFRGQSDDDFINIGTDPTGVEAGTENCSLVSGTIVRPNLDDVYNIYVKDWYGIKSNSHSALRIMSTASNQYNLFFSGFSVTEGARSFNIEPSNKTRRLFVNQGVIKDSIRVQGDGLKSSVFRDIVNTGNEDIVINISASNDVVLENLRVDKG